MNSYSYQGGLSNRAQTPSLGPWDDSLNDLFDFGSPRASHPAESTLASQTLSPSRSTEDNASDRWLSVPQQTDAVVQASSYHAPHERDVVCRETQMQRQIDELRAMVSSLIKQTRQGWDDSEGQTSQNVRNHVSASPRPSTQSASDIFGSFTFNQPHRPSEGLSPGWRSPREPLTASFEPSDDSPIYSRRGSAASVGSLSTKRGQRVSGGYSCTHCDSRFDVPSALRHHERKHLPKDERPHACGLCGDRFLFPKDVTRHERQVHSISRCGLATGSEADVAHHASDALHLNPPQEHKRRRRNLQQQQACRGRRTEYIKQLESTVRKFSHDDRDSNSRRDSAIADMGMIKGNPSSLDESSTLHSTSGAQDHELLLQYISTQQETIAQLEQSLQRAREGSLAVQGERDSLAEIFRNTAVFPGLSDDIEPLQPSTVTCAKSWLGAIEALLSSSEPPADTHESEIADAIKVITLALNNVHVEKLEK